MVNISCGIWRIPARNTCAPAEKKTRKLTELFIVESIQILDNKEQAEALEDKFAKVSQEYESLKNADIDIPDFDSETISVFK